MECGGREVGAFFEAHIEQGPILEAEEKTIGIVQGVQGISWFDVSVTGMESHAGTTPMERRRDALVGAAKLVTAIDQLALDNAPDGRSTVGVMRVSPNSRNVIPGSVYFSVDLRHPDADRLAAMTADARRHAEEIAAERGLEITVEEIWHSPPVKFADAIAWVPSRTRPRPWVMRAGRSPRALATTRSTSRASPPPA